MRLSKSAVTSAIVGSLLLVPVLMLCLYILSEQPHRQFDTYTKVLHGGNWVPDIFPHDIVSIREQHDIDTNEVWLRFSLTESSFSPAQHEYREISKKQLTNYRIRKPIILFWRPNWWFEELVEDDKLFVHDDYPETKSFVLISSNNTVYWWHQW